VRTPLAIRKRRAYCRKSPIRRHRFVLGRPTTEGVPGWCKWCGVHRVYPHTLDFRQFPVSEAAREFEGFTGGYKEERYAPDE
jgi:hypothetical protein